MTPEERQSLEGILQQINAFRAEVIREDTKVTQNPKSLTALQKKLETYGKIIYEFLSTFQIPPDAQQHPLLHKFLKDLLETYKTQKWSLNKSVFVPYWCDKIMSQRPGFVIDPEHCRRLMEQAELSSEEEVEDDSLRSSEGK